MDSSDRARWHEHAAGSARRDRRSIGHLAGAASGPDGKRAYGGQLVAQAWLRPPARWMPDKAPTTCTCSFCVAGRPDRPSTIAWSRCSTAVPPHPGGSRPIQDGRFLTTATVSFAAALTGPEHGHRESMPDDPDDAARDRSRSDPRRRCRSKNSTCGSSTTGRRGLRARLWWRATVRSARRSAAAHADRRVRHRRVPDRPGAAGARALDAVANPSQRHHGFVDLVSPAVHADRWNLFECRSPAAARGRGVVTASLIGHDGVVAATLVQEGLIAEREPAPNPAS